MNGNRFIVTPTQIKAFFVEHNAKPLKKFGQNFFINESLLMQTFSALPMESVHRCLEVGPGFGLLSKLFILRYGKCRPEFVALEKDRLLYAYLQKIKKNPLFHRESVEFLQGDILNPAHELELLLSRWRKEKEDNSSGNRVGTPLSYLFMGNLPYYISSDIVNLFISLDFFDFGFFILQQEYVDKLIQNPPRSRFGHWIFSHCRPSAIKQISSGNFYPKPKVDSTAFFLQRDYGHLDTFLRQHSESTQRPDFLVKLEKILRILFWAKRKTLKSILQRNPYENLWPHLSTYNDLQLDWNKRPEELETEEIWKLALYL